MAVNRGNPMRQSSNLIVLDYANPDFEGSNIDLKCPPRLTLVGPNASTCMGNGEWEPDLREVKCHGKNNLNMNSNKYIFFETVPAVPATTVNCGQPPPPPTNGHILPYTNTLNGAEVA